MAGKFAAGHAKKGGRKKGSLNKSTIALKDALSFAYNARGGNEAFAEWADENPRDFYGLWIKQLPTEVSGPNGGPIETANLTTEQREQRVLDLLTAAKKRRAG